MDRRKSADERGTALPGDSDEFPKFPYRILSIDGGGIYGLVSAIWLHHLCDAVPEFLTPGNVKLFAGISAGAVTALLLAKEKNPRDGVRNALAFWQEQGAFSSDNPLSGPLSLLGHRGLTGPYDFLDLLQKYFGDMRLEDLHHMVQISTFNWTGAKKIDFSNPWQYGSEAFWRAINHVPPALAEHPGVNVPPAMPSTHHPSWRPKIFTNWPDDEDRHYRVIDVAYGAASPAGVRAIRGGISDAGMYTANPSVEAIAGYLHYLELAFKTHSKKNPTVQREAFTPGYYLDKMHLLSIGNGHIAPRYWLRNFDLSLRHLRWIPTNPLLSDFIPPSYSVQFDGPIESADYICKQLLRRHYYRLSPGIMPIPVTVASLMSRFPRFRESFCQQIFYNTQRNPKSHQAVKQAAKFLTHYWTNSDDEGPEGS